MKKQKNNIKKNITSGFEPGTSQLSGKSVLTSSTTETSEIFFTITDMYRENAGLYDRKIERS